MADNLRPLTLLLAALCLWALSLLILALAGLGSRVRVPDATTAPPPLPAVSLTRSESRLGPIATYLVVGERPLMNMDRRPSATLAADDGSGAADLDVVLSSVLLTPRLQMAILTDNKDGASRRVRVGETVQGSNWRLVQLQARSAVIEGPSGQRTLELRVYDGRGGQAPTAVNVPEGSDEGQQPASRVGNPGLPPPPPAPTPAPPLVGAGPADPVLPDPAVTPAPASQDEQVEAIRRRIEARRAQMRAEAEATGINQKK